jgi:NADH-quinone oxidoreductase subunit N
MELINFFSTNLKNLIPEIFFSITLLTLILYSGCLIVNYWLLTPKTNKISTTVVLLVICIILTITTTQKLFSEIVFSNNFLLNEYNYFVKFIVFSNLFLWWLIIEKKILENFEFSFLILLSIFGLILIISSFDFISFYLALELQSLSYYILAAFKKNSNFSTEAGLKYFILGAFSSGLFLFGCSLIYAISGTTNFVYLTSICQNIQNDLLFIISSLFILMAIFFKLAIAPLHMWSPDVYEGAPSSVTSFFTVLPKFSFIYILLNFIYFLFYEATSIYNWWFFLGNNCALLSIFIGSLSAISQTKLKRLLAYSSLGHAGYLLLGIFSGNLDGISSVYFYLLIYSLTTLCIWGCLFSINSLFSSSSSLKTLIYFSEFNSIYLFNPFLTFIFLISFFSFAGIPPFVGFLSKFYIFLSTLESTFYLIPILLVFLSVLSTFYYLRLIKTMIFEPVLSWSGKLYQCNVTKLVSFFLSFGTINLIFLFIFPKLIYLISYWMALLIY